MTVNPFASVLSEGISAPPRQFSAADDVVLAADTLHRHPIPALTRYVGFSFDGPFRAKLGLADTPLTLPNETTTDQSGSELSPDTRMIPQVIQVGGASLAPTHICLRARAACSGSLTFWR